MGIIYCALNSENGMRYIGQSRYSLESRRRGTNNAARREKYGDVHGSLLTKAICDYGEDSFEWSIIFGNVPIEDLDQFEIKAIAKYNTIHPEGYNVKIGGRGGGKHSEESKKRMSEVQKRVWARRKMESGKLNQKD